MTIEEIQAVELEILRFIDAFCKERKICYFLDSGTLIGAARHRGFIPWDDDMDIRMPRPDYERFLRDFADSSKYRLYAPERKNSFLSYARVCEMHNTFFRQVNMWTKESPGVGVDVLPLDGAPDSLEEYETMSKSMNTEIQRVFKLRKAFNDTPRFRSNPIGFAKDCIHWAKQLVRLHKCKKRILESIGKINAMRTKYKYGQTRYCFTSAILVCTRGRWLNEWFSETTDLDFCGEKFPAPIGYDKRLTAEYGDWRTPPPEAERATHEANQTMLWRN